MDKEIGIKETNFPKENMVRDKWGLNSNGMVLNPTLISTVMLAFWSVPEAETG